MPCILTIRAWKRRVWKESGGGQEAAPEVTTGGTLLNGFAVQRQIEAVALDLFLDAQAHDQIDRLEDDERDDGVIDQDDDDALRLVQHLEPIALDRARGAAVFLDGEDAGQERADDAAHRVDAEGVERVVVA